MVMHLTYEEYKKIFVASGRTPMSLSKRAKIFAPFDAQSGLHAALSEKEPAPVSAQEISELDKETLDQTLQHIKVGCIVSVVYIHNNASDTYLSITGKVSLIDIDKQILKVIETSIPIRNIRLIEIR